MERFQASCHSELWWTCMVLSQVVWCGVGVAVAGNAALCCAVWRLPCSLRLVVGMLCLGGGCGRMALYCVRHVSFGCCCLLATIVHHDT